MLFDGEGGVGGGCGGGVSIGSTENTEISEFSCVSDYGAGA